LIVIARSVSDEAIQSWRVALACLAESAIGRALIHWRDRLGRNND